MSDRRKLRMGLGTRTSRRFQTKHVAGSPSNKAVPRGSLRARPATLLRRLIERDD